MDIYLAPVKSERAQQHIRERHAQISTMIGQYPTISKYVYHRKRLDTILSKLLSSVDIVGHLTYPELYLAPAFMQRGFLPEHYLQHIERGLAFVMDRARRRDRADVLGRLHSAEETSAIFELQVACALVTQFGLDAVEVYPSIAPACTKSVDFSVTRGSTRVLIEAVTQRESDSDRSMRQDALEHGEIVFGVRNVQRDGNRLCATLQEKIRQRELAEPLVVCMNQLASWPPLDHAAEIVGWVVGQELDVAESKLVAIELFLRDSLVFSSIAEGRARKLMADPLLLSDVRSAFCEL